MFNVIKSQMWNIKTKLGVLEQWLNGFSIFIKTEHTQGEKSSIKMVPKHDKEVGYEIFHDSIFIFWLVFAYKFNKP